MPTILILGYARHGKDTVAEMFQSMFGLRFQSSSEFLAERIVFPALKNKYNYESVQQCFEDRVNHRKEWFDLISEYNRDDPTALARGVLQNNDIYVGMRRKCELDACVQAHLFDHIIWVDRSSCVPPENADSCSVTKDCAQYVINNNGSLEDTRKQVECWWWNVYGEK